MKDDALSNDDNSSTENKLQNFDNEDDEFYGFEL